MMNQVNFKVYQGRTDDILSTFIEIKISHFFHVPASNFKFISKRLYEVVKIFSLGGIFLFLYYWIGGRGGSSHLLEDW